VEDKDITGITVKLGDILPPLLKWYDSNARALPWRENTDPYRVWVSEIMLQQTQVDTVIPYYERFLRRFPDIKSLAEAEEEQLLKKWEGLGYYTRARNLQKTARKIMTVFDGHFPEAYGDILSLPGIGSYTAGAIASICFGLPVPAVDGNVLRVIARITGSEEDISAQETKAAFAERLSEIYPSERSGDFTQSLMELGAVICLPKAAPKCESCPLAFICRAFQTGTQAKLPVKTKKPPKRKEQKTVFLLRCGQPRSSGWMIAVRKRTDEGLLGGLWEFPNIEGHLSVEQAEAALARWGIAAGELREGQRYKHVFTHVEWDMMSYVVECDNMPDKFAWMTKEKLAAGFALPSAFKPFFAAI